MKGDGKWLGNKFLLGFSSLDIHGGYFNCIFTMYLPTNNPLVGC
jgi:hypothetical protein